MTEHRIGKVGDFPPERGTEVTVDGISIAVFRIDNEFFGIQNTCPHKNLPLHLTGKTRTGHEDIPTGECNGCESNDIQRLGKIRKSVPSINCPWHNLEFNLRTGENEVRKDRIATYHIHTEGDDVILEL